MSTCNACISIRFIAAVSQTGSVKWITCLIDTVWTAWILTVFSVRFVTCCKIRSLLKIFRRFNSFLDNIFFYYMLDCRVVYDILEYIWNLYQYYSLVPSNQQNSYTSHQCVYMSCSWRNKHLNSLYHNIHPCKLSIKPNMNMQEIHNFVYKIKIFTILSIIPIHESCILKTKYSLRVNYMVICK